MPSKSTIPVALRLPVAAVAKARSNATKQKLTLSAYLSKILAVQLMRKR
jgi:hypothetical protein